MRTDWRKIHQEIAHFMRIGAEMPKRLLPFVPKPPKKPTRSYACKEIRVRNPKVRANIQMMYEKWAGQL